MEAVFRESDFDDLPRIGHLVRPANHLLTYFVEKTNSFGVADIEALANLLPTRWRGCPPQAGKVQSKGWLANEHLHFDKPGARIAAQVPVS